jgi:hypothetical protein
MEFVPDELLEAVIKQLDIEENKAMSRFSMAWENIALVVRQRIVQEAITKVCHRNNTDEKIIGYFVKKAMDLEETW